MSTALVIIDIQNDYFPGGKMELVGSLQAASAATRLLAAFRKQSWALYHVQHISTRPNSKFFLPDTAGVDIHEAVHPLPERESPELAIPRRIRGVGDSAVQCAGPDPGRAH